MAHPAPLVRRVWQRLEALHAVVYFSPEAGSALGDLGYRGFWMGYFAARAAPLGAVAPGVVEALFYNFAAARVARALPDAWSTAGPDAALEARRAGTGRALRRILGDADAAGAAAALAARAARSAPGEGRALFAANAALPWPDDPFEALWHAATLLREHRGDGHVALLLTEGIGGRESNVFQSLGGNVPDAMIRRARDYDDAEWDAIVAGLAARGLVAGGTLTAEGHALRTHIETRTDELSAPAYAALDDAELAALCDLLTPLARAVVATGELPAATPMGPTLPD